MKRNCQCAAVLTLANRVVFVRVLIGHDEVLVNVVIHVAIFVVIFCVRRCTFTPPVGDKRLLSAVTDIK